MKSTKISNVAAAITVWTAIAMMRSPLPIANAFGPSKFGQRLCRAILGERRRPKAVGPSTFFVASVNTEENILAELRTMSVPDLKQELTLRGISTRNMLEKNDLIHRLCQARIAEPALTSSDMTKRPTDPVVQQRPSHVDRSSTIELPLYLTYQDHSTQVADSQVTLYPTQQPYATIQVELPDRGNQKLSLLLDTACTGVVLRPTVVHRLGLPELDTPVTMTGAGGTSAAQGFTQLDRFRLAGQCEFYQLPAAVQDISALPSRLDGIVGLSFLSQFHTVDLDFAGGKVRFHRQAPPKVDQHNDGDAPSIVTASSLQRIPSLGLLASPTFFGPRGPVNMLVDTGAASTFLSWKGVQQLGLCETSPPVKKLGGATPTMGALGADNVPLALTHRLHMSSTVTLGRHNRDGLCLQRRTPVDIGNLPILDSLQRHGIGGILGMDVLMQSRLLRMQFQGSNAPRLELYGR